MSVSKNTAIENEQIKQEELKELKNALFDFEQALMDLTIRVMRLENCLKGVARHE